MTQHTLDSAFIRWQCRRGMLELDLLLLNFFDQAYSQLSLDEKNTFVQLLAFSDQELYGWLIGKEEPLFDFKVLIQKIRDSSWKV